MPGSIRAGYVQRIADRFLETFWEAYKETFISPEGYVRDRFRDGGEVTSEGQSMPCCGLPGCKTRRPLSGSLPGLRLICCVRTE
jgi:hypothetical protein